MLYEPSLIQITNELASHPTMYSLLCLKANSLHILLNQVHCFLDGQYLLCLSIDDKVSVIGGNYEATNLQFLPYFYNVNLSHSVVQIPLYEEMRFLYGYPDFRMFLQRDDYFLGILSLNNEEYNQAKLCLSRAAHHIENHTSDKMWSCRTRSEIISVLQIANGSLPPENKDDGHEILRYIQNNLQEQFTLSALCDRFHTNRTSLTQTFRRLTGMSPMQYILEQRLNQSRPDLLFTYVSIGEIAEKYGFRDTNYYVRAFKRRFGTTPLRYRTEGRAQRIRDEESYHQREKEYIKEKEKNT